MKGDKSLKFTTFILSLMKPMAESLKEKQGPAPEEEIVELSDRQIEEIRSSRLDLARGRFLENKVLEKEIKTWLKNR